MVSSLAFIAITVAGSLDLQPLLDRISTEQDVPGVSAVVTRRDEVVFAGGSGVADIESGERMTADTVLYSGSLSKIFTAVLSLKLVNDGVIALEEPVQGIAGDSEILVSNLLTHSSGLVREGDFGYWFSADFPDDRALRSFLQRTVLQTLPGEQVRYSNIGFATMGLHIADSTGESFHDALKAHVLEPLGMSASGSPGPANRIAAGYTPKNRIIPSEERPFAGVGRPVGDRHRRDYHDARAMTPAFGIYTTANDMSRLARYLLGYGDELMSDELRRSLLFRQNGNRTYGLGAGRFRDRPTARHSGWFAAHKSHVVIDLEAEIAVVVLANSDNADPGSAARILLGAVLDSDLAID